MKFSTVLAFVGLTVAAPSKNWGSWRKGNDACLSAEDAQYIVELSKTYQLKADLNAARAAGEYLYSAADYRQYGDSINALRGDPVSFVSLPLPYSSTNFIQYGTLVEPNGTVYVENVLSAPPLKAIETNGVLNNCTHIMWHFTFFGVGGPNSVERVKGFTLIGTDPTREVQPVIFQQVEFNSIAWAINTGFNVSFPDEGQYAPGGDE